MLWLGSGSEFARDLLRASEPPVVALIRPGSFQQEPKLPVPAQSGTAEHPVLQFVGQPHFENTSRQVGSVRNGGITYGDSSLVADLVIVYFDEPKPGDQDQTPRGTVIAEGHAVLSNPIGRVAADSLTFNYISKTGHGLKAQMEAPGVIVTAATFNVTRTKYLLHDVVAKSVEHPAVYLIHAKEVVVTVGSSFVAKSATLSLLGRKIYTFPRISKSLDDRVSGNNYPTVSLNSSFQPGLAYNSSLLLNDYTAAAGSYSAAPGSFPSYSAQLSKSSVDPGQTAGFITPRTDLDERLGFGYFDNVNVMNPKTEYDYISAKRETVSVGTFWNRGTIDRLNYQVFSKPIEFSYERSFALGRFRTLTQASIQDIRLESSAGYLQSGVPYGSDHVRFVAQTVLESAPIYLAPATTGHFRLAGSTFDGGSHSFGWIQSQIGAVYRLPRYFRVGAALVLASEFGDPLFVSDHLYSKNGLNLRTDFNYGPRQISLLARWDFDRSRLYDHEVMFSQLSGLFEPFIAIRGFPGSVRLGVQMRVDNVFKSTQRSGDVKKIRQNTTDVD
jgi:hypothetical protein